jgi:16S rRNA processing protein RimM
MHLVPIGKIVAAHGIRGYVRVRCFSTPPTALVTTARAFWIDHGSNGTTERIVDAIRPWRAGLLLKLVGVDDRTAAEAMVGPVVSLPADTFPPPGPGEFYYHEVIGFAVRTRTGRTVGTIRETFFTGASDVWVVTDGEREHLIPVIADVVREIDRARRTVLIEAIDGLLPPEPR